MDITHDHLNKLRIISTIKVGQKLDTSHGQLSIYEPGILNWLYRRFYNDSKDEGVRYLQDFYRDLDKLVKKLRAEILNSAKDELEKECLLYTAVNTAEKIKTSISGIENLAKTYAGYPKTTAVLEGIVQDFAIVTYKQLLKFIPPQNLSKSLKEDVTYNNTVLCESDEKESDI